MSIRHIIAVDPGDVNNGFCYFKHNSETKTADLKIMEVLGAKGLGDVLKTLWHTRENAKPDGPRMNPHNMFFVIENFRMDSNVRGAVFQWNELLTSQMIGRVRLCAEWLDAQVYMQEPGPVLSMGRKTCSGLFKIPKGHIPDDQAAFMHGVHFMTSKKLIRTVNDITMFGQGKL